jgi:low affinity Fe/Cu permease
MKTKAEPAAQPSGETLPEQAEATAPRRAGERVEAALEVLAQATTRWVSGSHGFVLAVGTVLVWMAVGPLAGFSESWQLAINTTTTIVTFVMVFLIQRSQSKEALAIQLKLNEVVAALAGASNRLVGVEAFSEAELEDLNRRYHDLKSRARGLRDGEVLSVDGEHARRADDSGRERPVKRRK